MIKVALLGNTGMLGGMVEQNLSSYKGLEVTCFNRNSGFEVAPDLDWIIQHSLERVVREKYITYWPGGTDFDFVINCIGAIKPVFNDKRKLLDAIYTNAVFPRQLADWCEGKTKLIHITTDCVFDGQIGGYTEKSLHNALDEYGKSKSLGEPHNCMVLRTSIIGPEWNGNKRSLVEWLLSNNGKEVNGFTNHFWNGLTTLELSDCIARIMLGNLFQEGTFHLFSDSISKFRLLKLMVSTWGLDIEVNPLRADEFCNRTLETVKNLNAALKPKGLPKMIEELKPFIEKRNYEA